MGCPQTWKWLKGFSLTGVLNGYGIGLEKLPLAMFCLFMFMLCIYAGPNKMVLLSYN